MKLIRCKTCNDVIRLIHTKWRTCECGGSGGQYNGLTLSATVGGDCEVIGIRNDFFDAPPFSKDREDKNMIIQGEYKGDVQIYRIKSPLGPRLNLTIVENDNTFDIVFDDEREYYINLDGNTMPSMVQIPASKTPSFKDTNDGGIPLGV